MVMVILGHSASSLVVMPGELVRLSAEGTILIFKYYLHEFSALKF